MLDEAVRLIKEASHPLLLVGAGANRKRTSVALEKLIDKTNLPFFTTQMGKGVIDERHPLFLGTAALSDHDWLHCVIDRADLIVNIGHDVIEKPPFFMEHGGKKVVHVNFFSAEVDEVYFPQVEVIGDIANSIEYMLDKLNRLSGWEEGYHVRIKEELENHLVERSEDPAFPLIPQRLVADVRKAMPEDGIIALDNGMYKIWFARNYKAYHANTVLLDNALATMGAGLPSAMAAKLVHPQRKVLSICGDGGFMMNSQEIETAVRMKMDLVVLILNDSGYGMIKWKQAGMGFENFGLDFSNPDFVKYGAHGHRIESTEAFVPTLTKCLGSKGVHLIDVPIDYAENERVLIEELQKKTCFI